MVYNNHSDREIIEYILANPQCGRDALAKQFSCGHDRATALLRVIRENAEVKDIEIILKNVELARGLQKARDLNRIKDKSFREFGRVHNALSEMSAEILKLLRKYDFSKCTKQHPNEDHTKAAGIVHLADLHLNELVDITGNKYDFTIASQRLKQFAEGARCYLRSKGVTNVLVANTGDILNSDRRLDELLSQATNRTNAMMLAVYLLEQFLLDLNRDFNISYAQVVGNEARAKEEPGLSGIIASDNYDWAIFNILRHALRSAKGIKFVLGDPQELVVSVANQNVLMLHGQQIRAKVNTTVQQIRGKYAELGQVINFVIFGDIHEARLSDHFARASSMVGANAYSSYGLQLSSRASQNVYILYENGNRDHLKIDLQQVNKGIKGYDLIDELRAYNAKSASKLHEGTVVFQVTI